MTRSVFSSAGFSVPTGARPDPSSDNPPSVEGPAPGGAS